MSLDANRELPASRHYGGSLGDSRKQVSFSLSFPSILAPKHKAPRPSLKLLASPHLHRFAQAPINSTEWITFQLLRCTQSQARTRGHQAETILAISCNWPYLTDFASHKSTHLHDDPADFTFFSDTSGRRTCYVAPERFDKKGGSRCRGEAEKTPMSIWLFQIDAYRCSPPIPPCSRSS
ncbi:hypothetical protein FIBSPDRAFT_877387 [Athelia psychrophila]|uniref:Uncharacterized protein n=1 Tax=Athelia psychrophila TaxID=1759441 RepID=A0A167W151_9AGAM|nr:hypothetical protein FIBSPDRAFT_877387 [Fibularhizoctonia sp. CBS 109695]